MANTLTFANQTITDTNIFGGISYLVDLNSGEEFSIGNTASACVSFVTDTQVPLYSKDSTNGSFTWTQDNVSRGTFYVTEVTKQASRYTVTAYDGMMLLDTSIAALGITTYPATASDLADAIETYSGYTITGTLNNGSMTCIELDDTTTIRQLLGYIAEISGASVKLNASDELCLMYYEDSEIELTASDYKELEAADYVCSAIDCVKIVGNDSEVKGAAGSGDNTLFISGNPFADSAVDANAQAILSVIGGITYTPLTCSLFNEEGLSVGTGATFGTAYTLIMSINSSTESGVTVSSVGNDTRAEFNKSLDLKVYEAITLAKSASDAVDEVHDYFWTTTTDTGFGSGAHITQKPRSQVLADPTHAGGNLLANSSGIAIRDGLTEVANFTQSQIDLGKNSKDAAIYFCNRAASLTTEDIVPDYNRGVYLRNVQYNDELTEIGLSLDEVALNVYANNKNSSLTLGNRSFLLRLVDTGILTLDSTLTNSSSVDVTLDGHDYYKPCLVITKGDSGPSLLLGIGPGGVNHGVYSNTLNEWLIHSNGTNVYVGGINTDNIVQKSMIARGAFSAGDVTANNYKDITVSFGKTFSSVPTVVCCISSTSTAGAIGSITASPHSETTTGCKIRVFNAGSSTRSPAVRWIATNA